MFCFLAVKEYSRVVYQSVDGRDLFTADHIRSMCLMENKLIRPHQTFLENCVPKMHSHQCCRSWSLGNYVVLLTNRTSCMDVTNDDVAKVKTTLTNCAHYYQNFMLVSNCEEATEEDQEINKCHEVPAECKQYNAVYHILHFLSDIKFMEKTSLVPNPKLTYTMTMLPLAAGSASEQLFKELQQVTLADKYTRIIAINFGIKHNLFDYYLQKDTVWFAVAVAVIVVLMWLYTTSLFLTIMTLICIFLALEISYFLYTMVFKIKFFPFMNLLSAVILIGIGADDVFIYCKIWALAKLEKNVGMLEKIISDTLRHASLSMFVTSFTTAAAFYANYISNITALQCFAIYAGTAILINFILMITWIPAVIVIYEKWCSDCLVCYSPDIYTSKRGLCFYLCKIPYKIYYMISDWSRIFFEKILPCLIVKLRYFWILLYGCISLAGILIIFYYPSLKLPSSNEFQVFSMDHPFEVYDFKIKDQFWFEKAAGVSNPTMPLTIVWGVKAGDNGYHLNPRSEGTLQYDKGFNVATPQAQQWLFDFCRKLRGTEMYQLVFGPQLTNCFIENFRKFMGQPCIDGLGVDVSPCCRDTIFPYSEETFIKCLQVYRPWLARSKALYFSNSHAGPRYSKDTGKMVALVVEFSSKETFSFNFRRMAKFYNYMNSWVKEQLKSAPLGMQNGWFVSHLEFYDLQETIAQGTPIAIGVSIAIAAVVAFLTTLNMLITIYAIVSIAGAIFTTVGCLVLLGWELNILESVTITIAVGLSIDFTLHYGMAYRLSPDLDREMRVVCSVSRMGSPVAMAAITTFLAGAMMMPSTVLAYRQLGVFLMLVMSISWLFATFLFLPLLRSFGPQGGFGQFNWPSCECCGGSEREHVDKTIYAMSESTLSSSSTNHANSSETHELEPLTEREYHPHRYKGSKLPQRISNGTALDSAMRDTVVSIQCTNHQKPPKITVKKDTEDDASAEKLLSSDPEEGATHTEVRNGRSNGNGDLIWVKRQELL